MANKEQSEDQRRLGGVGWGRGVRGNVDVPVAALVNMGPTMQVMAVTERRLLLNLAGGGGAHCPPVERPGKDFQRVLRIILGRDSGLKSLCRRFQHPIVHLWLDVIIS